MNIGSLNPTTGAAFLLVLICVCVMVWNVKLIRNAADIIEHKRRMDELYPDPDKRLRENPENV